MVKRKVLLVVSLYLILGVIAFLNFGFFHYITGKPGLKITVHYEAREDLDGNMQALPTEEVKESPGPPSDMEINN